jgi:acetyltransferase-like isoleucine patch superfamily enzyme
MKKILWALFYLKIYLYDLIFTLITALRFLLAGVHFGKNLRVSGWLNLIIHPDAIFSIGDNVRLNSGYLRNMVGGNLKTGFHVAKGAELRIENNVGISNSTIVCMNRIVIGEHALIGGDCKIYDTDFHPINPIDRANLSASHAKSKPVIIKSSAFIGGHCIILKGVTIGQGAVVGAGSVVSRDIPDDEIWAGNPIRKIGCVTHENSIDR